MTPEEQARLLARWLDHPDESVADGLDEDVVEAVVALRPDLAPPPRVTADEILGLVSAGPLAAAPAVVDEAPVAPEVEAEPAEVVPFPGRRWGRWAAGGVVGLMVAAAAALVVVVPSALFLTGEGADQVASAPVASPSTEAKKEDALAVGAPAAPAEEWLGDDAVADAPEAEPALEDLGSLGYLEEASGAVARGGAAAAGPRSSSSTGRELIPEVDATAGEGTVRADDAGYDAVADLDLEGIEAEEDELRVHGEPVEESFEYAAAPAPEPATGRVAGAAKASSSTRGDAVAWEDDEVLGDFEDADDWGEADVVETVAVERSRRPRIKQKERSPRPTRGVRSREAEAPAMDEDLADYSAPSTQLGREAGTAETTTVASDAPPPPADLGSLRSAAMPTDYAAARGETLDGASRAALDASRDAATELAAQRRYAEAGAAMSAHIAPPPEVGMDQAAHAARYYMSAGDAAAAVAACQAGLALSTSNTPARSYLLVMYGDALRQNGDDVGAEHAYRQAIALNEGRVPAMRYYDAVESASEPAH